MSHPVLGSADRRGLGTGAIVGIVVAVVAIAVGGFFLFGGSDAPDEKPASTTIPLPPAAVVETPEPVAEQAPAEPEPALRAPEAAAPVRAGDQARDLIAELRAAGGHVDLHQVHVRAVRYADKGESVDAFLLWFFAAREGHGPSAFVLGEMYDPQYFDAAVSGEVIEEADSAQALKWYQRALNGGESMADERIAALMQRIERAAARGDDDARRLMLAW